MTQLTEKQVIRALRRLEKGWPDSLWLFAGAGNLNLMRKGKNGNRVMTDSPDQDYSIESFIGIECDGGDW